MLCFVSSGEWGLRAGWVVCRHASLRALKVGWMASPGAPHGHRPPPSAHPLHQAPSRPTHLPCPTHSCPRPRQCQAHSPALAPTHPRPHCHTQVLARRPHPSHSPALLHTAHPPPPKHMHAGTHTAASSSRLSPPRPPMRCCRPCGPCSTRWTPSPRASWPGQHARRCAAHNTAAEAGVGACGGTGRGGCGGPGVAVGPAPPVVGCPSRSHFLSGFKGGGVSSPGPPLIPQTNSLGLPIHHPPLHTDPTPPAVLCCGSA